VCGSDLVRETFELCQVRRASLHLATPARCINREQFVEIFWRKGQSTQIELFCQRHGTHGSLVPSNTPRSEIKEPEKGAKILTIPWPEVPAAALAEPVDVREYWWVCEWTQHIQPVLGVVTLAKRHEGAE
jgi:hypothetical protein